MQAVKLAIVLGALSVGSIAGCGRVSDELPAAATDSGADVLIETSGPRTDGCPSDPNALPVPCTDVGKQCMYSEKCMTPAGVTATRYECQPVIAGGDPFTQKWRPTAVDCGEVIDAQGCPLGPPVADSPCKTSGVRCEYYKSNCDHAGGDLRPYECRASSGGLNWTVLPKVPCPAK